MYDFEIAFYLYKMAKIQNIFLDSPYRAKAYYSAGLALDAYSHYVEKMYKEHSLKTIPFVGNKIEKSIIEIIETGSLAELQEYERQFGIKDYSLLLSYGLSDALIKKLFGLSITSAYYLLDKEYLNNFSCNFTRSELNKIQHFVEEFQKNQGRYLLSYGKCLGNELVEFLKKIKDMQYVCIEGELSSFHEKISKIEISFNYGGRWEYLMKKLRRYSRIKEVHGKKYELINGKTQFGIPFVLTYSNVPVSDKNMENTNFKNFIKGDLHSHSVWTDGIHSIEQMAETAATQKYEYLAITDHSVSMRIAHGLSESQALSQIQEIKDYNRNHDLKLLAGIEVDILADGSLDYSDEVLSQFDFVIAAIHSHLNQETLTLYNRLERALANPYVNILAHPTSRLLGRPGVLFCEREPYKVSIQSIIELCKKNNVVLEINCFPERLDLNEKNVVTATEQGVKVSLGTDAHSLAHLCNIEYGIDLINKCNLKKSMVLNTYSYNELLYFFKNQRQTITYKERKKLPQKKKDFQYYFGNNPDIIKGYKSIIGIDLTGSEDKESGWAYMKGNRVSCRRIKSNKELIESIKQLNPDIISIDSPLAYPKGRCCSRKDCECSKYGIMRKSERMLRHFGITVYPCLIDSMVNLTTRGMKLAAELRSMGYTVIESYPGAAQDVLMIPRKGKTVEQFFHLKQGLISFGIIGDLVDNYDISHDEVDAITSALVGYFYLNGQYVGLGNAEEDFLIVPRIQEELLQKRLIIGLSGETGAGKTTLAEYLQFKYGLKYFRYSKVIEQKYHVTDKETLQKIGAQIAENSEEQRALTRYMAQNMEPGTSYVIDGLRHFEDYEELQDYFGQDFLFLYLECRYSNRYKRYNKLNLNSISPEKFEAINNHKSEMDIVLLRLKSDYQIDNNKGFKDLRLQIDEIIKKESGGKF